MKEQSLNAARNAFLIEAECLKQAFAHIDEDQFSRAVSVLKNAERIAASGCGHSGIACQHFTHLMCCIGRPARFISPSEAIHGAVGFLKKGDVILLVSRGGKTSELYPILQICKKLQVTVISVTENMDSFLARESDIVLRIYVTHETDKFDTQGTTSNTVMNALFDALQAALIEEIDYTIENFALIHPGGAVGARLNT